jgi:hypothetical protein
MKEMQQIYLLLGRIKNEIQCFSVEIKLGEYEDASGIFESLDLVLYSELFDYPIEVNINLNEEYLSNFDLDMCLEHLKMELEAGIASNGNYYLYDACKTIH